ncbi:ATP-binding protein [Brevundimonas nasdae]|uniref:ATP-binding protein n=1 Tax=Brevundimonas nasdae TaxID=172043 RepID=A0ACD4VNT1_9CAUL|nr:ATP-binding protein [Brevundimonas nasdae]WOB79622.1 ATP-binding protein [Brevundimonas nasdae]
MPSLNISDFSCLDTAYFDLAPVNVIIGPQGSGKSVTTKLFYFFSDILSNFTAAAERGESFEDYKKIVSRQFNLWFPPSAWGKGRSNITYYAGDFSVRMLRRTRQGRLTDEMAVTFSEWFTESYRRAGELFASSKPDDFAELESTQINAVLDRSFRVQSILSEQFQRDLGSDYISGQTFIPAGRAFFTSIGRLVAGFEQAGSLDPVTVKFARLFANVRDRNSRSAAGRIARLGPEYRERRSSYMEKFFGGEIRFEGEAEFIQTGDGRQVPFTSLSSGQQELLPMWSLIDYFSELDAARRAANSRPVRRRTEILYIEEPEAHLFPSAQSLLMEFLIGSVASERNQRTLIITTHSPYIMGTLNVFLKAGQLARRKRRNQDINEVVPRECWLTEGQLSVSAIESRSLRNLIDEDGLIDGTYLDGVSEKTSRDFSKLLQIESEI